MNVRIEFLKVWGHPTKNIICGPGDVVKTTEWIADNLIRQGYAKRIDEDQSK